MGPRWDTGPGDDGAFEWGAGGAPDKNAREPVEGGKPPFTPFRFRWDTG